MQREGRPDREFSANDAQSLDQTLETIRQIAKELVQPIVEYEGYVPGSQKSLSEKLAPFAVLDRCVAESLAELDARENPPNPARSSTTPTTQAQGGASPQPPTPPAHGHRSKAAATQPTPPGGRLSVLLDQLQERARLRRERGHSSSRLIKSEDFERREPSLGGFNGADVDTGAGASPGPRLDFEE
jgi:hypothetical protein